MPTAAEARAELARRELARREASRREQGVSYGNLVLPTGASPTAPVRPATALERRARPAPPRVKPETRAQRTQREGEAYARTQAGVSGDVQQAIGTGALRALGAVADMGQIARDPLRLVMPGRESQTAAMDRMGAFYNPTTDAGKLAEGVTMNVANAAMPGSVAARVAAVGVPAVAGEVSRITTRELGYDEQSQANMRGVGQFVGGLASGVRLGRGGRPAPPRPADPNAPFESRGITAATRGLTPAKLREAADRLRAQGIEPTLTDVTDEAGRGVIRAAASRQTPARQSVQDFAAARAENLPDRMGQQARRIVSDDARTPDQIREALTTRRRDLATTEYAGPYSERIAYEPAAGALADEPGRAALRSARTAAVARQDYDRVREIDSILNADAPLPMDAASRMARADAQGFTVEGYRGGNGERMAEGLSPREGFSRYAGTYFSSDPATASTYAGMNGGMVAPVRARMGRAVSVEADGQNWSFIPGESPLTAPQMPLDLAGDNALLNSLGLPGGRATGVAPRLQTTVREAIDDGLGYFSTDKIAEWAKGRGYGGVTMRNIHDRGPYSSSYDPELPAADTSVVFDPEDIRSALDAFLPEGYRPPPEQVSAATLDRALIAMRERAEKAMRSGNRSLASGLNQRANALDRALDDVTGLREARGTYRELSSQLEAADTGEQFLSRNTDEFATATGGMSEEARAVARATARRAIERASGENVSAAPGVARRLALAPEQQARNRALLGEDDAARLQSAMRAELDAVENARFIAPNTGSQTQLRQSDMAGMADEAIGTAANLATGNKVAIATRIARWATERGMSDGDARLLAEAAIDPARLPGIITAMEARNPQLASQLKQLLIRGAPVAAIAGSTAASQAQARPSPPR